jgi:hypothetical protein
LLHGISLFKYYLLILFQAATPEDWKNASSIYDFTVKDINGQDVSLEKYK